MSENTHTTWVTSYNVLSSHLSEPSHFQACKSEHLDRRKRIKTILSKLNPEIEKKSIICLQEVSRTFAGDLHVYFAERGYHFVTGLYGRKFNDFMGVGTAWPVDQYECLNVSTKKLADMVKWGKEPEPGFISSSYTSAMSMATWPLRQVTPKSFWTPPDDPWKISQSRENILLGVRLRSKADETTFFVSNYHMPCVYWCPPVMSIHAALAVKRTKDLAEGVPHILCGDFNFLPTSAMYKFVTTGSLGSDQEATPVANTWGKYYPKVEVPMRSAYAAVQGDEPNFTNYAKVKQQDTFIETLDYIFYSKGVEADSVVELPHRDAVDGPLPNAEEPSDHILIGAKLNITA